MGMTVSKLASGGLAVSQAPPGYGVPCLLAQGQAITVVPSGGLPIADPAGNIFAPPVVYVTFDGATAAAVTLSGGNLVATNTGTTAGTGVRSATASGKTSGKFYFEITLTNKASASSDTGVGVAATTATYSGLSSNGGGGAALYLNGNVWANGAPFGGTIVAGTNSGDVFNIAVDLTNRKAWFRSNGTGNWNAVSGADPVTNVSGATIPAGTITPVVFYSNVSAGTVFTANFGASAFVHAVPSGFTSGWPA
jgi:hypothetical protein